MKTKHEMDEKRLPYLSKKTQKSGFKTVVHLQPLWQTHLFVYTLLLIYKTDVPLKNTIPILIYSLDFVPIFFVSIKKKPGMLQISCFMPKEAFLKSWRNRKTVRGNVSNRDHSFEPNRPKSILKLWNWLTKNNWILNRFAVISSSHFKLPKYVTAVPDTQWNL